MLYHYLKVAFRNLWKHKVQNLIGMIGLAVAFLCFSFLNTMITTELFPGKDYPAADRTYFLYPKTRATVVGSPNKLMEAFPEVEKVTSITRDRTAYLVTTGDGGKENMYRLSVVEADTSFIGFFNLSLTAGNKHTITKTENSLVLYESEARKMDDPGKVLGKSVLIDGESYTITGILDDRHSKRGITAIATAFIFNETDGYHSNQPELWKPDDLLLTYIQLAEGVSGKEFQQKLDAADFEFRDELWDNNRLEITSLTGIDPEDILFYSCLSLAGLLVLLTAFFNFVSASVARLYNRMKEYALRKVNGAEPRQQFWLFFMELFIVFLYSVLLSFVFLSALKPILHTYLHYDAAMFRYIRVGMLVSAVVAGLILLLMCLIPARIIHRLSVRTAFSGLSARGKTGRGRNILLLVQLIILLMFFSMMLVVHLQIRLVQSHLFHKLSPEEQKDIIVVSCEYIQLRDKKDILAGKIGQSPAVEDILFSRRPLTRQAAVFRTHLGIEGLDKENIIGQVKTSANFHEFLKLEVRNGTTFTDDSDPNLAVVDEVFAALYPGKNPVGQSFSDYRIIGVVETIQRFNDSKQYPQPPAFYTRLAEHAPDSYVLYVKAVPGRKAEAEKHVLDCLYEFIPRNFEITPEDLHKEISGAFEDEKIMSLISTILFTICLVIGILSIYSSVTANTEKRYKEVAIRKINGATVKDVVWLFCKTYVGIWTLACLVVFPLVYFLGNLWLESFRWQISLNIRFFLAIYLSILLLILWTVIAQIIKAARENPAEVLKIEN